MHNDRSAIDSESADVVHSFDRGLRVLATLSAASGPLTLSEVGRQIAVSRATARRLLLTLRDLGYVTEEGERFRLRPKVMELGDAYLSCLKLPGLAHPYLSELADAVGDTCSLTVLDGTDVVYVDRVKASRIMTVDIGVGTRMPAYATSTGRVLLSAHSSEELAAFLGHLHPEPLTSSTTTDIVRLHQEIEKARRQGFAIADKELNVGLRSAAAPIRGASGEVIAAVNVSTHVTRTPLERVVEVIVPQLTATTTAISRHWVSLDQELGTALNA